MLVEACSSSSGGPGEGGEGGEGGEAGARDSVRSTVALPDLRALWPVEVIRLGAQDARRTLDGERGLLNGVGDEGTRAADGGALMVVAVLLIALGGSASSGGGSRGIWGLDDDDVKDARIRARGDSGT